ncbi:MAG: hypothetical protein MI923_28370 [Phycisphaerales bacterium]|nr:hypothetical protein [Phycisphaerales bacterium]
MDSWLIWSLILFAVGLVFVATEVIVPSGGLLGLVALICLAGSLASAYQVSSGTGATMMVIEVICVPAVCLFVFKYLPKTTLGKQLILSPPKQKSGSPPQGPASPVSTSPHEKLMGKEGVIVTDLRPSGTMEIDGRRMSVVSEGEAIDTGCRAKVVMVEGNRIVVEAVGT